MKSACATSCLHCSDHVNRLCREFMSRVYVESSCRQFMSRVHVESLCRETMFRLHSSCDVPTSLVIRMMFCATGHARMACSSQMLSTNLVFSMKIQQKCSQHCTTPRDSQHNTLSMHHRLILDYGMGIIHVDGYGALRASVSVSAPMLPYGRHGEEVLMHRVH